MCKRACTLLYEEVSLVKQTEWHVGICLHIYQVKFPADDSRAGGDRLKRNQLPPRNVWAQVATNMSMIFFCRVYESECTSK